MVSNFSRALLHFLYPPLCLHCHALLPQRIPLLCSTCSEQMQLLSLEERCPTCCAPLRKHRCERCQKRGSLIRYQIAALERVGPALTLVQDLRLTAPLLASLMAYQWLNGKTLLPDLLIPLPGAELLAQELSTLFSVPLLSCLRKRWDGKGFLTEGVFRSTFRCHKKAPLSDRHILLIALTCSDAWLRSAALALQPFFPAQISSLSALEE